MASGATHEHAVLLLQLYDLRREKVLRRARQFVGRDCKVKDFKDFVKRYPEGSKESTYVGMVLGYWDMACALVDRGLIDEELFNATTFEHVAVWFKLRPIVEGWRKEYKAPGVMASLETVAARHPNASSMQPPSKGKAKAKAANKAADEVKREQSRLEEEDDEDDE